MDTCCALLKHSNQSKLFLLRNTIFKILSADTFNFDQSSVIEPQVSYNLCTQPKT